MASKNKRPLTYGNTQVAIGVLMPDTRYKAFKRLILGNGLQINKVVRDLIEDKYKEELDKIEELINIETDSQESKSANSKASERNKSIA